MRFITTSEFDVPTGGLTFMGKPTGSKGIAPMTDFDILLVYMHVREFLAQQARDHLAFSASEPKHFAELLADVYDDPALAALAHAEAHGDDLPRLVVAISAVGPAHAGPPPREIIDELGMIADKFFGKDRALLRERLVDIVIGYGSGVRRALSSLDPTDADWRAPWKSACNLLAAYVEAWLRKTAAWLHFGLRLPGFAFRDTWPSFPDALELARRLRTGFCDCWRVNDDATPYRTRQRYKSCLQAHHLLAWEPWEVSLNDFVAQAIKGAKVAQAIKGAKTETRAFAAGAIVQGMYFADLYSHYDVHFGKVLGWQCLRHPKVQWEGPPGTHCLACRDAGVGYVFTEERDKQTVARRLVVKGQYGQERYWHCQNKKCGNYYHKSRPACPLCGDERDNYAQISTAWVRVAWSRPAGEPPPPQSDDLRRAIAKLNENEKRIIDLLDIKGWLLEEVAQELGRTPADVEAQHQAILKKLKHELVEDDDDNDNEE
jgi:uncharacterized OB-fold protein